ncbi:hypothetical protein GCM10010112_87200 [Actinoplanes lobatus]|uniref:Uncharacterized protein n=1 Tax=Actinoplanes lobatus TaxID=113568 RepID=A0A7W7HC05_9ACTN|nr:hypothetical protein [Actinoplanes lobatus]MBB4747745.1 hypothetical protein [Actinoplanes lobatus]GGN96187.1 hypothetical protein GCM10010112_87200 [Actinoplanes lobatus]GIE45184.1 hypothetical protein Alo02nite_80820 [Actinoplanes lobatus]
MLLTYHPAGQETPEVFEFRLQTLRSPEIEAIERRTGMDYGTDYRERLLKGNMLARRALLWTFLRRRHPYLKFDEVEVADGELILSMDLGELAEQRAQVLKLAQAGAVDPDDVDLALAAIDMQVAEWRAEHPDDVVDVGPVRDDDEITGGDEQPVAGAAGPGKAPSLTWSPGTGSR